MRREVGVASQAPHRASRIGTHEDEDDQPRHRTYEEDKEADSIKHGFNTL